MTMEENASTKPHSKSLYCDEVAWLMASLRRYRAVLLATNSEVFADAATSACLCEIMATLNLSFGDADAAGNGMAMLAFKNFPESSGRRQRNDEFGLMPGGQK